MSKKLPLAVRCDDVICSHKAIRGYQVAHGKFQLYDHSKNTKLLQTYGSFLEMTDGINNLIYK